jgi:hypothetical protein
LDVVIAYELSAGAVMTQQLGEINVVVQTWASVLDAEVQC